MSVVAELAQALGLDPDKVQRIVIDCDAREDASVAFVTVHLVPVSVLDAVVSDVARYKLVPRE